jgi:hypothetical protein
MSSRLTQLDYVSEEAVGVKLCQWKLVNEGFPKMKSRLTSFASSRGKTGGDKRRSSGLGRKGFVDGQEEVWNESHLAQPFGVSLWIIYFLRYKI